MAGQNPKAVPRVGGRSTYRNNSRGGHGPFGGGSGRNKFSQHPLRSDVGTPSRGRRKRRFDQGGSKRHNQSAPDRQLPDTAAAFVGEPSILHQEPVMVKTEPAVPEPALRLSRHPILPVAWCDICRVDCNSLDILEQHKNGKRHKKTVRRIQEIEAQQKQVDQFATNLGKSLEKAKQSMVPILDEARSYTFLENGPFANSCDQVGEASEVAAVSQAMRHEPCSGQVSDVNRDPITARTTTIEVIKGNGSSIISANLPFASTEHKVASTALSQSLDKKIESSKEGEAVVLDAPDAAVGTSNLGKKKRPTVDDRSVGPKLRFKRGGKRLRYFEQVRSKAPERPREKPRVCTLCKVTCDTLAVFDCHLAGKKHISRMKRFQGPNSVFGPISVFIPPNQVASHPTNAPEPVYYGLKSREIVQQEAYTMNAFQVESHQVQQGGEAEWHIEAQGLALNPQSQQGQENPANEVFASAAQDAPDLTTETYYNSSGCEENIASQLTVAPGKLMEDGTATVNTEDVFPVPKYEVTMLGLDPNAGASAKNE